MQDIAKQAFGRKTLEEIAAAQLQALSDCDEGKLIHNPHDALGVTDNGKNIIIGANFILISQQIGGKDDPGLMCVKCELKCNEHCVSFFSFFSVSRFLCPYERLNFTVF